MPLISVIIPLYNKERYVSSAIESVLAQSFDDYEILIIDDGSTDDSITVARTAANGRARIIIKDNGGPSSARNEGLRHARGDFAAFLDADDRWYPQYLETIHRLIETDPGAAIYATAYLYQGANGQISRPRIATPPPPWEGPLNLFRAFTLGDCPLHTSSTAIRRNALRSEGWFDESFHIGEDQEFFFRSYLAGRLVYCSEPLVYYRRDVPESLMARYEALRSSHVFVDPAVSLVRERLISQQVPARLSSDARLFVGWCTINEVKRRLLVGDIDRAKKYLASFSVAERPRDLVPLRLLCLLPGPTLKWALLVCRWFSRVFAYVRGASQRYKSNDCKSLTDAEST